MLPAVMSQNQFIGYGRIYAHKLNMKLNKSICSNFSKFINSKKYNHQEKINKEKFNNFLDNSLNLRIIFKLKELTAADCKEIYTII